MPTYEYECSSCGDKFEVFQSMKDAPLTVCPRCGGQVHRLINGGAGIIYKGSGFYSTDSGAAAKNGKEGAGKNGKNGKESGGGKEGKKAEAAPAAGPCGQCPHAESGACAGAAA